MFTKRIQESQRNQQNQVTIAVTRDAAKRGVLVSLETYRLGERRLQSLASSLALFRTPNPEHEMNLQDPFTMKK